VQQWKAGLRGKLLRPGDEGYDTARRVYNGGIDRHPAFIVRAAGVAAVVSSVNFARQNGLTLSVRSGGHGATGAAVCEGGVMLDLSGLKGIRLDPAAQTVRIEPGVLTGELDHESQAFGLATTLGSCSITGLAGVTLSGGIGYLARKFGLTIDNLLSADIVTADGKLLTAGPNENEDLFWAIRGGGGNFGVVTSLEYKVHRLGPIVAGGFALYPMEQAREALRFFREATASAPDELTLTVLFMAAPPAPFIPPHQQGVLMIALAACYAGPIEEGMKAIAPVQSFGTPVMQQFGPMPYLVLQHLADPSLVPGAFGYVRGQFFNEISDECIEALIVSASAAPSRGCVSAVRHLGGAISRVPEDATAYSWRDAQYSLEILPEWTDPAETERHTQWVRDYWEALLPHATGTIYLGFLGDEGDEWLNRAYSPATYRRLAAIKQKYDPGNLFSIGQNIKPAGDAGWGASSGGAGVSLPGFGVSPNY
jgi:FAD/FMN-containing dehydrogenase